MALYKPLYSIANGFHGLQILSLTWRKGYRFRVHMTVKLTVIYIVPKALLDIKKTYFEYRVSNCIILIDIIEISFHENISNA
jgi:hypothetical protein